MFTVGPAFYSLPRGDHPPGDGLTRLQCLFAGSSTADVSTYAIGNGGNNNGTVYDGYFEIVQDSAIFRACSWQHDSLGYRGDGVTPLTVEMFYQAFETTSNPPSTCLFSAINVANMSPPSTQVVGFSGGINNVNFIASPLGSGYSQPLTPAADVFGSMHHLAYTYDSTGRLAVYHDGSRQVYPVTLWASKLAGGRVDLGATGVGGGQQITFRYYGVRVRRALMYSGASFAPLTGPEAWGPP